MNQGLLLLHECLCAALLYSCFCRAVKTDASTQIEVLVSFYCLSVTAIFATFAPLLMGWEPDAVSLCLLASITLIQSVTARHWRGGVPAVFKKDPP